TASCATLSAKSPTTNAPLQSSSSLKNLLLPSQQPISSLTCRANPSTGSGPVASPWVTSPCLMPPPAVASPSLPSPWPPASPAALPFPTAPPPSKAKSSSSLPTTPPPTPLNRACKPLAAIPTISCSCVPSSRMLRLHSPPHVLSLS